MANLNHPVVPDARMRQDLSDEHAIAPKKANAGGQSFPLALAKVLRVDPRKRVVDLICMTGKQIVYRDVLLPFAAGGARHFLGALPEPADVAVIGYTHEESGFTRTPVIIAWVIPGVTQGYDWLVTQFTGQDELAMTPEVQENLKGIVGRRRHKAMLMESGNVGASSSQGSDMLLDESVTLANRRGNEIVLRDQDQSLVVRTLQQFHAGAGFRVYGGMAQRDATFLPSQMFSDGTDWSAERQVDANGVPLAPGDLTESNQDNSVLTANPVFDVIRNLPATIDPAETLQRGLFTDENGNAFDDLVLSQKVYGGKSYERVTDPRTGRAYSEYRIEVANTSDGTLPVSEQTDGIDIDRLLPSAPGDLGESTLDPTNRSPDAPMVEFILGTAVGNDPTGARESYARPLKPVVTNKSGGLVGALVPAEDGDSETEHAAFLVRVRNPVDMKAPDAFMAITKGGVFKSYFPGKGSKGQQEYYGAGREMNLGPDDDGHSLVVNGEGTVTLVNWASPRSTDNVGVVIQSLTGAVEISGGGSATSGEGADAVAVKSATGIRLDATTRVFASAPSIRHMAGQTASIEAGSTVSINSGQNVSVQANVLGVMSQGRAEYAYGGPLNGLATNGSSRDTVFTASPATGALGGPVDTYRIMYGKREEIIVYGASNTTIGFGNFDVRVGDPLAALAAAVPPNNPIPGDGVNLSASPTVAPGTGQCLSLGTYLTGGGARLSAMLGNVNIASLAGNVSLTSLLNVGITAGAAINMQTPVFVLTVGAPNGGGILTDGVIDSFTGRPFISSGTIGVVTARVI